MRRYETTIITPPNLAEGELDSLIATVEKDISERYSAKILNVERWGRKTLSYPIKKCSEGFYVHFDYESDKGTMIADLESRLRLNEQIIRFLTVRRDEEMKTENSMKKKTKRRRHGDLGDQGVDEDLYLPDSDEDFE